jgi:hypothetical protein
MYSTNQDEYIVLIKGIRPQKIVQSTGITFNEADVTSLNFSPPLMWTCQQKNKKNQGYSGGQLIKNRSTSLSTHL